MDPSKLVVKTCCCCVELRKGSLICGYITLGFAVFDALYNLYLGATGHVGGWIGLAIFVTIIIMCAILIKGVQQERRKYVQVGMWGMCVMVVILIINSLVAIAYKLEVFLTGLVMSAFGVYQIIVVNSYILSIGAAVNPVGPEKVGV